jgi:hypothetical protein
MTGLFTDLGIELSQLFFYKSQTNEKVECQYLGYRLLFSFIGCISEVSLYLPGNKDAICRCLFPSNSTYL